MKNTLDGGTGAGLTAALILAAALFSAPAASAKTTTSSNWSGYAVHRSGLAFRQASGTWIQPNASCLAGRPGYSAVWVGIGGFRATSDALEQIGTEVDCSTAGEAVSTAWYELVPARSATISLAVRPGDVVRATVTVVGYHVTVDLQNLTTHRTFRKLLKAAAVDVSSAEWIVEAPSECIGQMACQALPLANFGSVRFDSARATATTGAVGSITARRWWRTKIELTPGARQFIVASQRGDIAGSAIPSTLRRAGSRFDVTYSAVAIPPRKFAGTRQSRLRAGYLEH